MKKKEVYNLIILDESGSMESIKSAIITGFNEVVQTIQSIEKEFPEQEHYISLLSFNGVGIKTIHDRDRALTLTQINESSYQPNATTPLYDAIGQGVLTLKNALQGKDKADYGVLVTILSDGEENASKEFNAAQTKALIEQMKAENWTFTYIGANQDVERVAMSLSIQNTLHFEASLQGSNDMFIKEMQARVRYSKKMNQKADLSKGYYDDENNA